MAVARIEVFKACRYKAVLLTKATDNVPDGRIARSAFDSLIVSTTANYSQGQEENASSGQQERGNSFHGFLDQ